VNTPRVGFRVQRGGTKRVQKHVWGGGFARPDPSAVVRLFESTPRLRVGDVYIQTDRRDETGDYFSRVGAARVVFAVASRARHRRSLLARAA
jgi:hypothetical protein